MSAACYEHAPHIGLSPKRMDEFSSALSAVLREHATSTAAWCVLPNHYHVVVETTDIVRFIHELGRFHGRTSHAWNGEEHRRGRQVFHGATDRFMRSDRHAYATINYVHHNPVHHGYALRWTDWPWSSAEEYLERLGRDEAERRWREHPIRDYGKGWDDPCI